MSEQPNENEDFGFGVEYITWPRPVEGEPEKAECALVQVALGASPGILIEPNPETETIVVNISELKLDTAAFLLQSIADGLKTALKNRGEWDEDLENDLEVTIHDPNS